MSLNAISLEGLRSIPMGQKVALLGLLVAAILVGFYFYVVDPKSAELAPRSGDGERPRHRPDRKAGASRAAHQGPNIDAAADQPVIW